MYQYQPSPLPNTRVDAADILRGIAIAGIILIHFLEHMGFYLYPVKPTPVDTAIWDTVFFMLAGKMYGIFAMLFGLSFFIQHDNQAKKGVDFRPRFVWRMILLAAWGVIDLVFYNYILKCFVLIDLKMGQLAHQDIGQMQMYVNYYTRELMNEGDNPPIGIVLCADKCDAIVKYTLPENNNQIFASKYFTYLPTEDELKRELRLDDFQKIE